jgi:histidine triad (HIT) family protein
MKAEAVRPEVDAHLSPDHRSPDRRQRRAHGPQWGVAACLFCEIAAGRAPAHLVLDEPDVVAFLDIRPLFPGHTLVVPRAHVDVLAELPTDLVVPYIGAVQQLSAAMESVLGAAGSFVAVNNRVSQSQPHLHTHVVPRNRKDGLRGFFWPRTRYEEGEAEAVAARLRDGMTAER